MLSKHPRGHRGIKHREKRTAACATQLWRKVLHLLGGVSIPGVVVLLAVLLRPQSADISIFLEFFGPLLHSLRGLFFSERIEENGGKRQTITLLLIVLGINGFQHGLLCVQLSMIEKQPSLDTYRILLYAFTCRDSVVRKLTLAGWRWER